MKHIALAFPLIILIECIIFANFLSWQNQAMYEFEQRQRDLQTNYATDAAVQEMLASGTNLGTDYASWGEMTLEPEIAYNTYVSVLLRNFGWADNEINRRDLIESSVPFFCVAVYDGYYMCMRQREEETRTLNDGTVVTDVVYPMRWTPKLPYSETKVEDGSLVYYFYNLGDQTYGTYRANGNKLKYNNVIIKDGTGSGSLAQSRTVVNETLTDACNSAMFTGLEGNVDSQWYLPSSFSDWTNSNPVMTPSVLTYLCGNNGITQFDTVTFAIGGAKVDDADFCICYSRGDTKCYTWASNRAQVEAAGLKVERVTTTPNQAAAAGYYFDVTIKR